MIEAARRRVGDRADVTFHVGRFEDVDLAAGAFAAVFSATAFHWVDPAVGLAQVPVASRAGRPARTAHAPRRARRHNDDGDAEFRALIRKYAPEVAETLSPNRDLESILAGADGAARQRLGGLGLADGRAPRPRGRRRRRISSRTSRSRRGSRSIERTADELDRALQDDVALFPDRSGPPCGFRGGGPAEHGAARRQSCASDTPPS